MKKIGKAFGASLNTVALAAMTGAWRAYGIQVHRDPNLPESEKTCIEFKTLVPVALSRPMEECNPSSSLVNRWVYSSVPLPLGTPQASLRIREVRANCEHLKSIGVGGLQLAGQSLLPTSAQQKIQGDLLRKHSLTVTNVPGPQVPMKIAGQMVQEIQIVLPSTTSQVGLISYAGFLCANIVVDPEVVPHAEVLATGWSAELQELYRLSMQTQGKRKRNVC
jgi:diacylglycerol O-acyltransferase